MEVESNCFRFPFLLLNGGIRMIELAEARNILENTAGKLADFRGSL